MGILEVNNINIYSTLTQHKICEQDLKACPKIHMCFGKSTIPHES